MSQFETIALRRAEPELNDYLKLIATWQMIVAQALIERPSKNTWVFDENGDVDHTAIARTAQRIIEMVVVVRIAEDRCILKQRGLRRASEQLFNDYMLFETFIGRFYSPIDQKYFSPFRSARHFPGYLNVDCLRGLIRALYKIDFNQLPFDILGKVHEALLGRELRLECGTIRSYNNDDRRKAQGSYYTPRTLVRHLVDHSLGRYLYGTVDGHPDSPPQDNTTHKTLEDIQNLRILDSACGSGAFLTYAYEVLEKFYQANITQHHEELARVKSSYQREGLSDDEIAERTSDLRAKLRHLRDYRGLILETHLYGIDIDPQATAITAINLMLLTAPHKQKTKLPPIINWNIHTGNTLIGLSPNDSRVLKQRDKLIKLRQLRQERLRTRKKHDRYWQIISEIRACSKELIEICDEHFTDYFDDPQATKLLHWGVTFPEVFYNADGYLTRMAGFDFIISNPPWEVVKPDLRKFYRRFDDGIDNMISREEVEQRVAKLDAEDPKRAAIWEAKERQIRQEAAYYRDSGAYALQGQGDIATHKLYIEQSYRLLHATAYLAYVLPKGIYSHMGTKVLREHIFQQGSLDFIISFTNRRYFFTNLHPSFRFVLLGAHKGKKHDGFWTAFQSESDDIYEPIALDPSFADSNNLTFVNSEAVRKFSPESLSIMEFQTPTDYELTEKIYGNWPLMGEDDPERVDQWSIKLARELDTVADHDVLNTSGLGFPLYEGKMIHQFDPFYTTARYHVESGRGVLRFQDKRKTSPTDYRQARMSVRAIARNTDIRTLISTMIPSGTFIGHSLYTAVGSVDYAIQLYVVSLFNSFVLDYVLRQKITNNVTLYHLNQLPLPPLNRGNPYFDKIVAAAARLTCIHITFAELWRDVMGEQWVRSKGTTEPMAREYLRNDIDALVAHLYGLSRSDFDHILGTFPIVFPDHIDGRVKREELLDIYDEWGEKIADWAKE